MGIKKGKKYRVSMRQYLLSTLIKVETLCFLCGTLIPIGLGYDQQQFIRFLFAILLTGLVLGIIAGTQNYKKFVKPINLISEYAFNMDNNDLSYRVDLSKTSKQRILFEQLNNATESIAAVITRILSMFQGISRTSDVLWSNSEQITSSTDQVAQGVGQVAEKVSSHTEDISVISNKMALMAEEIGNLGKATTQMEQMSQKAIGCSTRGQDMIRQMKSKVEQSDSARTEANNAINLLDSKSKEITVITDTIISISDQTNLLALNAAIEAARAGEHGRGFAVVAEEIRKLAEQSSSAVKQIMELIKEIQQQTEQTVGKISDMGMAMDEQNKSIQSASELFMDITGTVNEIGKEINNVNTYSGEINVSKDDLVELINNILSSSEDISRASQEIAACTQEQNAAMSEIRDIYTSLYKSTEELSSVLRQFRV